LLAKSFHPELTFSRQLSESANEGLAPIDDTMYLQEGTMQAQVLKWGNSLAVRIPKPVAEDAHLQVGDPLEIAIGVDGVVQMHRVGVIPTLAELVAQITPENRYAEISVGQEIGREAVEW
jgi:antitoxin MazE